MARCLLCLKAVPICPMLPSTAIACSVASKLSQEWAAFSFLPPTATVPISVFTSKTDPDEELMNGDGQVAVDVSQLQRAGVVLQQQQQRGQVFGLSALSLEEQRLLQSLDRLNQRLQCKIHVLLALIQLARTNMGS
ncbi:hypothetical protein NFI96_007923 [Prochilodus magdalenae]|nr:hypothetical protein NFI96_007923 [Prochilodus magdalenae]